MILLKAYSKNNLGDDLFIKIITQRYNHEKFVLINGKNNITFKKIKNLEIKKSIFDKILEKLIYKYSRLELKVSKTASLIVLIGGSMFIQYDNIENVKKRNKFYYLVNKPYYILGTNFGPYKDEEYFLEYKKIFSEAKDICFREKYSYDLFENRLENVRYASDIVFSLKTHQNKNDNN